MNKEVVIRYRDVNGYPNRLYKVTKSEEEAKKWFEQEHPQCEIIEVKWRLEEQIEKERFRGHPSDDCHTYD